MLEGSDTHGRRYSVVQCVSLTGWKPDALDLPKGYSLFVAIDAATWSVSDGLAFARRSIEAGCASVSTWGTECELLHDLFDEEQVALELDDILSVDVMTIWHADVPLEDAIDFFVDHDIISDSFPSRPTVCVALSIGSPLLARRMEGHLCCRLSLIR